jgi:predicted transcriptional regulator
MGPIEGNGWGLLGGRNHKGMVGGAPKSYGGSSITAQSLPGMVYVPPETGEDFKMPDEQATNSVDRELATQIVAAYVRRNQIGTDQLHTLISTVYQALASLGKPAAETAGERTPAVPIRRSVTRDYVVCLECGLRGQMLRRHVTTAHGLSVEQYRARWMLPADHPLTAPGYSERRSTMAKQIGLGRGGRGASGGASVLAAPESPAAPEPRRRGRPRSKATS